MKLKVVQAISLLISIIIANGCFVSANQTTARKPSVQQLSDAIDLSKEYLIRASNPNGQFTYIVNEASTHRSEVRYNILRHAGTMYALTQTYQRDPDDDLRAVLMSASHFLKSNCMRPLPGHREMLGIWSLRQSSYNKQAPQIKLGATGLGLVALLSMEKIIPGTTSMSDLRNLGRFLLYMQKPDGSFFSKYIPHKGGKSARWISLYYPGEAALGLLMLNDLSPSRQWLVAATKAIAYLIRQRDITTTDQWLLIASAKLLSMKRYPFEIISRKSIIQHISQVCERILQEQILYADNAEYIGGYCIDGRTTPTATRLEGLLAALRIIDSKDATLRNSIKSSAKAALLFLLRSQITKGKYSGGIPRSASRICNDQKLNTRIREIRIDYVQHALSAMIQYEKTIIAPNDGGISSQVICGTNQSQ